MLIEVVVLPAEFVAVTVKLAGPVVVTVGVPEITPLVVFRLSPFGRAGETE